LVTLVNDPNRCFVGTVSVPVDLSEFHPGTASPVAPATSAQTGQPRPPQVNEGDHVHFPISPTTPLAVGVRANPPTARPTIGLVEQRLIDAIEEAFADPTFPWRIRDMEPEAPIRGLKIIVDFMEQIAKPVHSSSFNVGDLVDMIVAEPTTDQGVHERSEDHLVNTNYGIFVIKSRPGIVVEKFEEYCMVAELGRRNNRILDGLSLMGLIERMGVLPSDAAPFDLATLSEDHELYRLIYDPVRVAENVGRGKPFDQCSIVQPDCQHPCRYTDLLVLKGRLATKDMARLLATIKLAKQLRTELLNRTTGPLRGYLPTQKIYRRPQGASTESKRREYDELMGLLAMLKRKAREATDPANNPPPTDRRDITTTRFRDQVISLGDTASDDVTGTVQTLSSMTAPTAAKFVATSSIHPDRRPSMEVSALIQAIEQDSRIACESASMQITPIQVARDIARIEWEEMANDADLVGVNLPSKKRKLDEITKLHKEADSQSMGPMTILRGIKRLKQKVRGSILSDEDSRTEAMRLYSELDSVTTGMEKLQAKSTLFLDRD